MNHVQSYEMACLTMQDCDGLQVDCGPSKELIQIPNLWGSRAPVSGTNFIPVDLSSFAIDPAELAPAGWNGRLLILCVMKDGLPDTKLSVYLNNAEA